MNSLTSGKLIGYLAFIFVAGGATGAVITFNKAREREAQPASMEKVCTRIQDRLITRLSLTPAQVDRLKPVFEQTAQELRAVHSRAICETEEVFRKAHLCIARELNPEQKAKLEKFDSERQEWLRRRIKGRTNWSLANPEPGDGEL